MLPEGNDSRVPHKVNLSPLKVIPKDKKRSFTVNDTGDVQYDSQFMESDVRRFNALFDGQLSANKHSIVANKRKRRYSLRHL